MPTSPESDPVDDLAELSIGLVGHLDQLEAALIDWMRS